jgi:hypothetical protein
VCFRMSKTLIFLCSSLVSYDMAVECARLEAVDGSFDSRYLEVVYLKAWYLIKGYDWCDTCIEKMN